MGIQGLLPLLKPIQRQKHLSEFAGQTIAVDAYVWLHRGAYACAADLVLGRPTRRYVDFCMARVRLLRHHRIEPYLVFDGGPLPAKLVTEKEREKRREENAKRAKELWAQGRKSQAVEYFTKCVDVTPQMAYQVIKALKAENVKFVVAPYEADAQLAYLERAGLVDGILTEDSDLLVFGCHNVLVKLDTVSATVVNISRMDFGSAALAKDSFSLTGWTEAQFRWMAILSGCDYLPSIAGVGLKTAYHLLKKYRVVDKVVKMIQLEGKKNVPKGYLNSFYLAEKVFLHQRVYDPLQKRLVYLTSPPQNVCLSEEVEMYIGRDMEPSTARRIAEGEACPITLVDMEDINPSFAPKPAKPRPLQRHDANRVEKADGRPACGKGDLLNFLTPLSKPHRPPPAKIRSPTKSPNMQQRMLAGNASGKRTLIDVIDCDIEAKRKRVAQDCELQQTRRTASTSRFFSSPKSTSNCNDRNGHASDKENIRPLPDLHRGERDDPVTQEDGYLSPSPCLSRAGTPDISSPILSCKKSSLDVMEARENASQEVSREMSTEVEAERVLVRASSEPAVDKDDDRIPGPDVAQGLETDEGSDDGQSDATSEIFCWDDDPAQGTEDETANTSQESLSFSTKRGQQDLNGISGAERSVSFDDPTNELELLEIDLEDIREKERNATQASLAQKWRLTYSLGARGASQAAGSKRTTIDNSGYLKTSAKTGTQIATSHRQEFPRTDLEQRAATSTNLRGTLKDPITIELDEVPTEIVYSSKARLQTFRFSA